MRSLLTAVAGGLQGLISGLGRPLIAVCLGLTLLLSACSGSATGLSGNYVEDTVAVADSLLGTIALTPDDPSWADAEVQARALMNDYVARYRPRSSVNGLSSFTTMQTALNSLAGHYANYPNRPLPEALQSRLNKELRKAENSATRGA
jgi:photosystem II Psb27 protein